MDQNQMERAFGWDDEITVDNEYKPLMPGEYEFTVVGLEREYFEGSEKMPACPRAIVEIEIEHEGINHRIKNSILLHSKLEGIISSFFTSIGQKKKGETLKMNWSKVVGSKGRCKTGIRTYKDDEFSEVKRWLPPNEQVQTSFTAGAF